MSDVVPFAAPAASATEFASPERASVAEVSQTAARFTSEGLLCSLLDAMPECVMILNEHRQIVYGNEALVNLAKRLGCQAFLGQRPGELLSCQTAARAISGCGTSEACRNCGTALTILESLDGKRSTHECRILSNSGGSVSALDLRVWGTHLEWRGEQYALLVVGDISPIKRRQVLERIFFHDILNTAGSIQGIAGLLAGGDASVPEMLGDLSCASESLVNEIKSQRMLLAAENNELQVNYARLRGLEMLELVTRSVRNHPVAEGRPVCIAEGSADFPFCSDPALLGRVLGNLLKNALEGTPPGQSVTMGCRETETDAVFWCQNASCMPRDVQLQVFQRSFSTKGSGRGLGTYSIKLLTERYLKGHVAFVSSPTIGTIFTVTLPSLPPGPSVAV